jgi:hypothetical protein
MPRAKSRSKYAGLDLPKLPVEPSETQQVVEKHKEEIVGRIIASTGMTPTAAALALEYEAIRDRKDRLEDELSNLNKVVTAYEQLIADQFDIEGIEGGLRYSLDSNDKRLLLVTKEPYAQVQDRNAYRQWCIANGMLNDMMISWHTTNAMVKQLLHEGEKLPPGVIAFFKDKITLRGRG